MVANPRKFHLMFLALKETEHLDLNSKGQIIRASGKVKLLGVIVNKKFTFGQHVEDLCMKVSSKMKAFSRSVIMSNFNYCPLIWLFHSKAANSTINRVHKRVELLSRHDDKRTSETAILEVCKNAPPHKSIIHQG